MTTAWERAEADDLLTDIDRTNYLISQLLKRADDALAPDGVLERISSALTDISRALDIAALAPGTDGEQPRAHTDGRRRISDIVALLSSPDPAGMGSRAGEKRPPAGTSTHDP